MSEFMQSIPKSGANGSFVSILAKPFFQWKMPMTGRCLSFKDVMSSKLLDSWRRQSDTSLANDIVFSGADYEGVVII